MMKNIQNVGSIDRIVRVILGVILFTLAYFSFAGIAQIIFYILGAVAFLTGISGYCLLYSILKISTAKK